MIPFFAAVDPAFKLLAPRSADWLTILPEASSDNDNEATAEVPRNFLRLSSSDMSSPLGG